MSEHNSDDRIVVVSRDARRFASTRHVHPQAQLIYAISGVVCVTTADGTWVVPSSRAVFVPAGVEHETRSYGSVQFRALLIDPADVAGLPGACAVVAVTPLLRELIVRLAALAETPRGSDFAGAVTRLMVLELAFVPVEPLNLPTPRHLPLARLCERMRSDPAGTVSLEDAAAALHMSRSSFMRLFRRETGLSFVHWRQQARLLHALSLLAQRQSIVNVALACGYDSPSAFSAVFRRCLGQSPSRYFDFAGRAHGRERDPGAAGASSATRRDRAAGMPAAVPVTVRTAAATAARTATPDTRR